VNDQSVATKLTIRIAASSALKNGMTKGFGKGWHYLSTAIIMTGNGDPTYFKIIDKGLVDTLNSHGIEDIGRLLG
jgi:hypothetical protein